MFGIAIRSNCDNKEDCNQTITFRNQSGKQLYVTSALEYPDTLYIAHGPSPSPAFEKVQVDETNTRALARRSCMELVYKDLIPSDTLMIYVFDAHVIESTPWTTVIDDDLVLKRYDLSLQDLRTLHWTITYP